MRCLSVAIVALALAVWPGGPASADPEPKPADKEAPAAQKPDQQAPAAKPEAPAAEPEPAKPDAAAQAPAAEKEKPPTAPAAKPAAPEATTLTVAKGPFKIEVNLDGYFEARDAHEVVLRTKAWADLEVAEAVKHGAAVRQGDVLVRFSADKIAEAIAEARTDLRVADLTVQLAEVDLKLAEAGAPIDMASVERGRARFAEDYERFQKVGLPLAKRSADLMLRQSQEYLEMEKEELRQLEKMYKADDLTEDTEEIILKRQRSAVEFAEFRFEQAKLYHEETMKTGIPRRVEDNKVADEVETLRYRRMKEALPLMLEKAKADLEKARVLRSKAQEKLDNLAADREAMTVKAPADGVLYYGRFTGGKLSAGDGETPRKGDKVQPNKPLLTVVKTRPAVVAADVPEDKLHAVQPGMKARVEAKAFPDRKVSAVVAEVDGVPAGDGKFRARLTVALDKEADAIMPGMACKARLVPYLKTDAVTLPKAAVETDPLDEDKHYVYVVQEGREPKRQPVTLGRQTDKEYEITAGLAGGEKVLAEPPKKK